MTHDIVCVGDLHLKSGDARHETKLRSFDQIVREGVQRPHLAAWVVLGDVFDGRSSVQDRNDFATRLVQMATLAPCLVVRGNHDALGDLVIFGRLGTRYPVTVVESALVVQVMTASNRPLSVFCLPYPERGGLVSAGASTGDVYAEGQRLLEALCLEAGQELARRTAGGHLTMMAGHVAIGGAETSVGQPSIGRELELTAAALQLVGRCPEVFGHIHLPQTIFGAHYAGSVAACNFGERERKRYLVVTFDDSPDASITSYPLDTPRLFHVEGDLTREGFTGQVLAGPGGATQEIPASWAGAEVRVRYRFRASERDLVNPDLVRAGFREAARVHLDPIAIPDRGLRAPQVASARTLAEKLTAWAEVTGNPMSRRALDALARLEAQAHDAVLATLDAELAAIAPVETGEAVVA
jgi:exonuclease SbcD